jgi:hypothetical protein
MRAGFSAITGGNARTLRIMDTSRRMRTACVTIASLDSEWLDYTKGFGGFGRFKNQFRKFRRFQEPVSEVSEVSKVSKTPVPIF